MMAFGELNVFSAADAQSLISHCAQWLKPGGIILIGEPYWRQVLVTEEIAHAYGVSAVADFRPLPDLSPFSTNSTMT